MTSWSTTPNDPMINNQQEKETKRFPTEQECEDLMKETLQEMNNVFYKYYANYANYCGSNIREFEFPSIEDIFNQFHNYLKRQREPDYPKRKTEKAPCTYGDYRRMKDDFRGPSDFSAPEVPTKRQKIVEDDWDDSEMTNEPVKVTPAAPTTQSKSDDWGEEELAELQQADTASTSKTSWNDRPKQFDNDRQQNFSPRGGDNNFRGRGGRGFRGGRGGFNRDRNDSDQYGGNSYKNNDNGWKKNATPSQGTTDDGWGDVAFQTLKDSESFQPKPFNNDRQQNFHIDRPRGRENNNYRGRGGRGGRGGFNGGNFRNNDNNMEKATGTIEDDGWGDAPSQTPVDIESNKKPVTTHAADDDGWND